MQSNKTKSTSSIVVSILMWVVCVILVLMLICNMAIIIKGSINPDVPPDIFGITPLVVLTDSMSGDAEDHIEAGDLIVITRVDPNTLEVGDVITFMEKTYSVTHRIIGIEQNDKGEDVFVTKGDFNNTEDRARVNKEDVIGVYNGIRFPGLGHFALFLQTPVGMLVFIGIPIVAFIAYDIIRRKLQADKKQDKTRALEEELERLRAQANLASQANANPASQQANPATNPSADAQANPEAQPQAENTENTEN